MPELKITIRNKRASGTGTIVCGNSDYTVLWDLDEEWASFDTKTMRVQLPDGTHQDVVFTGNSAGLPVQNTAGWVSIGLFAGDVHTSRGADFRVLDAITTAGGPPAAPAKDVYAQVMAKLNQLSDVTAANVAAAMGLSGLAADDQIMVSAVDADGKPTGWRKKYRDMLNVRDFGAKGDGTTDDTAAIQAALDAASTRGISAVLFPTGTYKVSATTADSNFFAALTVHSGQRLLFDAATLQLTANGYDFYAVLNIHNVNNVTVEGGLTIIGDRESHTATTGESGHGIRIVNSHNVHVSDVDIRYTWGDGVCVGGNGTMDEISQNVTLERIRTYKCSRNGLSIIEADGVVVRDCDFTYTDRTAPQYGIDVEPNLGTATNITIENVRMLNNAIGSVICNTALIAALTIAIRPSEADRKSLRTPVIFFFIAAVFYAAIAYTNGAFTRLAGIVLLVMFVVYMVLTVRQSFRDTVRAGGADEAIDGTPSMGKDILLLVVGAAFIAVGANLLVNNGTLIAQGLGVPESVIALTFVALGTSLPELVTAITSLVKGHSALSLGNIVGANLFNLVLVSGLSTTLSPFQVPQEKTIAGYNASLVVDIPLMMLVMLLLTVPALAKGRLSRWQGIVLLVLYAGFCAFQFCM